MTQSFATQVASFALAALVTLGAFAGVGAAAAHQRAAVENEATMLAMTAPGVVQHVTVIAHRAQA